MGAMDRHRPPTKGWPCVVCVCWRTVFWEKGPAFSSYSQSSHVPLKEYEQFTPRFTKVSKDFKHLKKWKNMAWVCVCCRPFSEEPGNINENVKCTDPVTPQFHVWEFPYNAHRDVCSRDVLAALFVLIRIVIPSIQAQ